VCLHPKLVTPRLNRYIPHTPTAKQSAYLLLPHIEAFYGGQPGGGKSDALLMGALQYVDVPGYAAIIFRRTYADLSLPGALMDRAHEWLSRTAAQWNETRKTWTFPEGGTLSFGYLENEKDKYRYQSAEFHYVAFDEVSQFLETQYTYLFSRLRRLVNVNIPLRMRSASNPPTTADGQWVKTRFVLNRSPKCPFIPAGLEDNPYIDKAEYLASLANMDDVSRNALFDWFASVEGLVFNDFGEGNLTDEGPDLSKPIELAIDDGYYPDPRATLFVQNKGTHILVFDELYQYRTLEEETVEDIQTRCHDNEWPTPVLAAVSHEAPGLRDRLRKANIPARNWLSVKVTGGERSTRIAALKQTRALIKDSKSQRIIKINRRCKNLIWEITQGYRYPEGKHGADDTPEDKNDHAVQALESWVWLRMKPNRGPREAESYDG
jgi:hypothetical protein